MPRRYHVYPPSSRCCNVLLDGGRLDPGGRLPAAAGLSAVVAALGQARRAESRGTRPGLEWQTSSPPPPHNFDSTPIVTEPPYNLPGVAVRRERWPRASPVARTEQYDTWSSSTARPRSGCGSSWPPRSCCSAGCSPRYTFYRIVYPGGFCRGQPPLDLPLGGVNTAC